MLRLLRVVILLLAAWPMLPARAAMNYQDMWWLPAESGWGVMVLHQANTVSAVLFHYDGNRRPVWYLLSNAPRSADEWFSGTLYEVTGPSLFGAFDPATVLPRNAGTMSLHFTSSTTADLSYTIDGRTTTRAIERITFSTLDVDGTYFGAQSAVVQCDNDPLVGNYVFPAEITVSGGAVRLTRVSNSLLNTGNVSCDWSDAAFSQAGSMIRGNGQQTCRTGDAALVSVASFEVEQMRIVDHAITINYRASVQLPSASVSCTERGVLSGTRLLRPN